MSDNKKELELLEAYFDSELDFDGQSLITKKIIEGDSEVIQGIESLRIIRGELNIWNTANQNTKVDIWSKIERDIQKIAQTKRRENIWLAARENLFSFFKTTFNRPIPLGAAAFATTLVFVATHSFHRIYSPQEKQFQSADASSSEAIDNIQFVSRNNGFIDDSTLSNQLIFNEASSRRSEQDLDIEAMVNKPELKPLSIKLLTPGETFVSNTDSLTEADPIRFALIDKQRPLKLHFNTQRSANYNFVNYNK